MPPKADWEKFKGTDADRGKDDEPIIALDDVSGMREHAGGRSSACGRRKVQKS